uniref:Uncharacterized protein n=1 Tax=Rhizophora mucronata TaxID=61149 RepID=A0A2P2NZV9_RHIMU
MTFKKYLHTAPNQSLRYQLSTYYFINSLFNLMHHRCGPIMIIAPED